MGDSTSSLDLLWQQASAARDLALRALRQAEANAQAAELQGEQLDQYRSGYRSRWTTQFAHNGTAPLLHCYQVFGQRLNDVIGMQHGQTAQAQHRLLAARALVQQREQRVAAVTKLIERRQREAQQLSQRREQRDSDEAAQRSSLLRTTLQATSQATMQVTQRSATTDYAES